ncbi:UNVERIFIED_CONTAM: hypothetical protein GTU68_062823, partial [Idotea baltica]|nr:hypothetical protein [Idotea baltica]
MSKAITTNRPNFSAVNTSTIKAELDVLLVEYQSVIDQVATLENPTWETLIQPMEELGNKLSLFWSPVSHLNSVMNSEELREAYNACLPTFSEFNTKLGQNNDLYNATLRLRDSDEFKTLDVAQQKSLNNEIRDFELGGVSLTDADKKRYGEIAQALSKLTTKFSDNVLDATNAWEKLIDDENLLKGLPDSALAAAKQRAEQKEQKGWLLNLEFPTYYSVMLFCDNAELRQEMYTAYGSRASDKGPHAGKYDNSDIALEILQLRAELAGLLGYNNYAEKSVVPKMVDSPKQVVDFLNDLAQKSVPEARCEYKALEAFANSNLGIKKLFAWDVAYASDKLKQEQYAISDEDL